MLLAGYGVTISSIVYTSKSHCASTGLGSVSKANGVIFLILGSLNLVVAHILIWIPICKEGCGGAKKPSGQSVAPSNMEDSTSTALNQQPVKSD